MKVKNIILFCCIAALITIAYLFNNKFAADKAKADIKTIIDDKEGVKRTSKRAERRAEKEARKLAAAKGYRLSVSFYSVGEGIDRETNEKYIKFIESQYPEVKLEKNPWGREGEADYCFKLTELNKDEQQEFIAQSKRILGRSKLVKVYENQMCPH